MEAQVDVGHRRPDAGAGLQLRAGVHHVVEHLAVQLLRHRPPEQARHQPVEADRLVAVHLVERQAVEHGKHRPFRGHAAHLVHRGATGVEPEVPGIEQEGRHRRTADLVEHGAQLIERCRRQVYFPIAGYDRVACPSLHPRTCLHCFLPAGRCPRPRIPRPGSVRYRARGTAGADRLFRAAGGRGPVRRGARRPSSDVSVPR